MNITFGMAFDGAVWATGAASLGVIKLGPLSMLAWLENRLGLDGVRASAPERINFYMQKIRQLDPGWCRASFQLDPWSTAKQMLAWRDELLENGWDAKSGDSPRLKTLAAIEASAGALPPGLADRMQAILRELPKYHYDDTLLLQDPFELLPWLWQQIIRLLEKCGMTIRVIPPVEEKDPEKFLIQGADEFVLARECGRFLAAGDNCRTAIICEGDSAILDGTLHRKGFGRLNFTEKSRWRESLQILPLWLETLWAPFHPQRFLELLLLPASPIPRRLANALIDALQKEPGIGGDAWNSAWTDVQKQLDKEKDADALTRLSAVWQVLQTQCFTRRDCATAGDVIAHCDFLIKRLSPRIGDHSFLALVVEDAKTLKKIVADRTEVKRMELSRILDSIISTGTTGNADDSEVTDFAVFSTPGMIDRDFDTIIWWNFVDGGTADTGNWTPGEIAAMPGFSRDAVRKRENLNWHSVLKHATKNVLFFVPRKIRGTEVFPHPLLDEMKITKKNTFTAGTLSDDAGQWQLAGRSVALKVQKKFSPCTQAVLEKNDVAPRRRLSYSQLNTLISCPFQWFLQDYVGLRMPPAMLVPSGPLMLGTLAHKIVENIYQGKEKLAVSDAVDAAAKEFDAQLPAMAAELLFDGRSVERMRIRNTLLKAVEALVSKINDLNLLVKGSEKELTGELDGFEFQGFSDIYLETAAGAKFVIDMKWSASSRYEEHLKQDKALQLATYSWLLDPEDLDVRCAYFLFPKKQLVYDPAKKWDQLWENARRAWRERLEEIHNGKLSRGIKEEKDLKNSASSLPLTAGCTGCNYVALCGMMED